MRLLVVAPLEIIDLFAAVDFFRELSSGITTIDSAPYVFLGDDIYEHCTFVRGFS